MKRPPPLLLPVVARPAVILPTAVELEAVMLAWLARHPAAR